MTITEASLPLYSICTLQVFFVLFQWINMISRKADRTQVRFLILTITFLAFNIAWISLSSVLPFTTWKEIPLIGFLGILMVGYTCFYITKEIGLAEPKRKALKTALYLIGIYAIQLTAQIHLPTLIFEYLVIFLVIFLQIMALIRVIKLIRPFVELRKSGGLLSPIKSATVIIACTYCFSPLLFTLVSEASIEFVLINIPFVILSVAYISHHVKQSKSESKLFILQASNETLNDKFETIQNETPSSILNYTKLNIDERNKRIEKLLEEYELTDRQLEIAVKLLNGAPAKLIADQLDVAYSTVRGHITKLTEKVGVEGIKEFRQKFQGIHYPTENS